MTRWEQLIAARERLHLSQEEAARRLDVGLATYKRWEMGKRKPQPHHMRALCELFDPWLVYGAQEARPGHARTEAAAGARSVEGGESKPSPLLTTHLWSLALADHATGEEKRAAVRRAIEECDSMNTDNTTYRITRREAIGTLATLPLVTFGLTLPGKEVAPVRYGEALMQCAASLEACWELYTHGGASELLLGYQCTSRYQDALARIGQDSARHREEAVRLAAQYALLKTVFGWHCSGTATTVQYARHALALSRETGDPLLQLSAYSKLAGTYLYGKNDQQALATTQEAQAVLERFEGQTDGEPIPAAVRGGIYALLAMAQARNGLVPDDALAKSMEHDPGMQVHAYLDFTRATMFLDAAWIYCSQGDHVQAMQMLEKRVDPETFAPRMPGVTAVGRVETMNLMALSSLRAKDRDLERTIHFWRAGVEGAKDLCSDVFFALSSSIYEHMTMIWPGEARLQTLRDHLVQQTGT